MARKCWSDLSPRTRRLLMAAAGFEGLLKAAALADLVRRPAGAVRGPKLPWAAAIILVNAGGAMPAIYFKYGRRNA